METAHLLEQLASVHKLHGQLRGVNPKAAQELLDLREMSLRYELLPKAEVGATGVTTGLGRGQGRFAAVQSADLIGISDRAVRLARTDGRLDGELVGGRWQVTTDEAKRYRDERCA